MKIITPTLDELASAVPSSPTPDTIIIYSTIVSSPTPNPIPVYSMVLIVPKVPPSPTAIPTITNFNAIFANTVLISYAFGQCPHLSLIAQQEDVGQSILSAQAPISCPIVAPALPLNIQLDPADTDFLRKKSGDSQERQKNIL